MTESRIEAAGAQSVIIRFGTTIYPQLTAVIRAASDCLARELQGQILELIPAYTTLMVVYDVLQHDFDSICAAIERTLQQADSQPVKGRLLEIPVFYEASVDSVIKRHSEHIYQVFAIGFAPGFAYLGNVPGNLTTLRRDTPRLRVPAGSVAIADQQTAVYPLETPGGWNTIGRSCLKMLDRDLPDLCPLGVGDRVRFTPVSRAEFLAQGGSLAS